MAQLFLALQVLLSAGVALLLAAQHDANALPALIACGVYLAGFLLLRRGWEPARKLVVVSLTLLLIASARKPYLTERAMLAVLVPPIAALVLTSWPWVAGAAVVSLLGVGLRTQFRGQALPPLDLLVFVMAACGLVIGRRSMDAAHESSKVEAEGAQPAGKPTEAARSPVAEPEPIAKREAELLHLEKVESIGRLAGGVAHDFNNLLTVIGASASMAERATAAGGSPAEELREIQRAVGRASELTKQLLAFARKQVLLRRTLELGELVSSVERMLPRLLGESVTLSTKLAPQPLRVMADAGQLEQVIVNLVLNARDAIASGSTGQIQVVTSRISVSPGSHTDRAGLPAGDYACIAVRDNGVGMSDEVKQCLFEPFFTTKAQGRGAGLGLATAFGIVRQHEGTIRVESAPGRGTLMQVLLPLASALEANPVASAVVRVASRQKRVLVVEDEPQVRAIAARALTNAGYEVSQAGNGATALSLVREQSIPFDVIVSDVLMPELSGPELARAVRTFAPEIAWIFMSGYPEALQGSEPEEFAGAAFLAKPFSPQKLVEVVGDCIGQRERHEGVARR